jgi:hypothetical protein
MADFDRNGFMVEMEFFVLNRTDPNPITINFFSRTDKIENG